MGGDRRKSRRIKTRGPVQNAPRKEAHQLAMIGFDPETGVFNVSSQLLYNAAIANASIRSSSSSES